MAVIKSGDSTAELTVDATPKAARVILYDPSGNPIYYQETFKGIASTFRTLGSGAVPQNLFTIENQAGSGGLVYLRGLFLSTDMTGVLTTEACTVNVARTTAMPTGGTALTKLALDTTLSSNASVVLRGATASDGGAATAITATAAAGFVTRNFLPRQATAVGQVQQQWVMALLPPPLLETDCLILRQNQALVVQILGTAASNASTNHYVVSCVWDEVDEV